MKFKFFASCLLMMAIPCTFLTSCKDDKEDGPDPNPGPDDSYAYVDLGLPSGLLWAQYNVGANAIEELGGYYAWGETEEKTSYTFDNYKYLDADGECEDIGNNISGTEYDVAHVKWGGKWRMPTGVEVQELINSCTWVRDSYRGVECWVATGPNGNKIIFPKAGYYLNGDEISYPGQNGSYWSATANSLDQNTAYYLVMGSNYRYDYTWKPGGQSVRAVRDPK